MNEASEKQIEANRANALLGGVKTEEGKRVSRFNATKHGILRESISDYEKFDYEAFFGSLMGDFPPRNMLEEMILERIAVAYIKLMRASKAETEFIKETLDPTVNGTPLSFVTKQGYESVLCSSRFEQLSSVFSRYETSAENRFYKAIDKLLELRNTKYEQA